MDFVNVLKARIDLKEAAEIEARLAALEQGADR
jgi:hypothetical protein